MPSAFNTEEKAVEHLTPFNDGGSAEWTAKLSVGKAVGHTQINLFASGTYAGTLQGDILGAALYPNGRNSNADEGPDIPLTWEAVLLGVDECYAHPTPWGTWLCHDITAAIFRRWGLSPEDVYRASPTAHGFLYVIAHIASKVAVPGTAVILGAHELWNFLGDGFDRITRPSSWNFRF